MRSTILLSMLLGTAATFVVLDGQEPETLLDAGVSTLDALNEQKRLAEDQREALKQRFVSKHPRVLQANQEFEHLRGLREAQLKKMPMWSRCDVSAMNDDQLRKMVAVLVERVAQLEKRVEEMSLPPKPRLELLDPTP